MESRAPHRAPARSDIRSHHHRLISQRERVSELLDYFAALELIMTTPRAPRELLALPARFCSD
jgi:hypothetical protein